MFTTRSDSDRRVSDILSSFRSRDSLDVVTDFINTLSMSKTVTILDDLSLWIPMMVPTNDCTIMNKDKITNTIDSAASTADSPRVSRNILDKLCSNRAMLLP